MYFSTHFNALASPKYQIEPSYFRYKPIKGTENLYCTSIIHKLMVTYISRLKCIVIS